jgi:hypothetical protein
MESGVAFVMRSRFPLRLHFRFFFHLDRRRLTLDEISMT